MVAHKHIMADVGGVEAGVDKRLRKGRGACSNRGSRYDVQATVAFDDGWETLGTLEGVRNSIEKEYAKSIISRNESPDISFDQSINPYRGCEHGCIYCYARPTHCYLGLSAGLDFESRLFAKVNADELLERELANPKYTPKVIALGAVTDPYQPIERDFGITRRVLEVLAKYNHPVGIVTKSAGILRDVDLLASMASKGLVKVAVSVTTLDRGLARSMEPRAATPTRRIEVIERLVSAGVPTTVMVAPVIPALNDAEIEKILSKAKAAGANEAGYVLLRLPMELKELFREWLATEYPDRANKVISILRSMHGGRDYVSAFGTRQRGKGLYAEQIAARFQLALKRLDMNSRTLKLRTDLFRRPSQQGEQLSLF